MNFDGELAKRKWFPRVDVRFEKFSQSFDLPTFYIDFEEVDVSMT